MRVWWLMLALLQALAGLRVVWRLLRTARGERIRQSDVPRPAERVSVIVPVLNERRRLGPCLAGLIAQPEEVTEILVVDGGSTDGTSDVIDEYAGRDSRVQAINAAPIPVGWNGKAYGLQIGLEHVDPASSWILTVDADVRVQPSLIRSLLARAARRDDAAQVSVATRQRLSGAPEGVVHPALLTTLVYRFGIPGQTTRRVDAVQANGQCALIRRSALEEVGGFALARTSFCEDVTVARALANAGHAIGFHESDGLAEVAMYEGWHDAWQNWTRSLPMRDRFSGAAGWRGLAEVTLAQALPLPLLLLSRWVAVPRLVAGLNLVLLMVRLGVLLGTARAYACRPRTYWLSPLLDLPVSLKLWQSALRREQSWRGRVLIRDDSRVTI